MDNGNNQFSNAMGIPGGDQRNNTFGALVYFDCCIEIGNLLFLLLACITMFYVTQLVCLSEQNSFLVY